MWTISVCQYIIHAYLSCMYLYCIHDVTGCRWAEENGIIATWWRWEVKTILWLGLGRWLAYLVALFMIITSSCWMNIEQGKVVSTTSQPPVVIKFTIIHQIFRCRGIVAISFCNRVGQGRVVRDCLPPPLLKRCY